VFNARFIYISANLKPSFSSERFACLFPT